MLRFVHAADLHLDSPLRGLVRYDGAPVEEVRAATRRAFDNLVQLALGSGPHDRAHFVLLAGDLYDGDWNDFNTGLYFTSAVSRLAEEGIEVLVVRGNHDAASRMTRALRLPRGVHMLRDDKPQTVMLERHGVAVHGQSFAAGAIDRDLTLDYPARVAGAFNIGMLHTSLTGRAGHDPYAPTDVERLRRLGYDYWALGHVHTAEIVCREPWIVFPGNTQGRSVREAGPRGCALVTVQDGAVEHRFVPLDVVRWQQAALDIRGLAGLDAFYESAQQVFREQVQAAGGRTVALRLELAGRGPLHRTLIAQGAQVQAELRSLAIASSGGGLWLERIRHQTADPVDAAALLDRDDPLGLLVLELRGVAADDAQLRALAHQALADLEPRLPPDADLRLDDPQRLRELLRDIEGDLLTRLADGGGAR